MSIVSTQYLGAAALSTTVAIGASGNNRMLVVGLMQERTPPNLTAPTVDGVAMTQAFAADGSGLAAHFYYMDDVTLPSAAGNVAVAGAWPASIAAIFYIEGVDQTTIISGGTGETTTDPESVTLTGATATDVQLAIAVDNWDGAPFSVNARFTRIDTNVNTSTGEMAAYSEASNTTSVSFGGVSSSAIAALSIPLASGGGGDTTAPVLSNPSVTAAWKSATTSFDTDTGEGTSSAIYYLASEATDPTKEEVDGNSYASTIAHVSVAVSAAGTVTLPDPAGLAPNTAYKVKVVHKDAAGNIGELAPLSFTTLSASVTFAITGAVNETDWTVMLFDGAVSDNPNKLKGIGTTGPDASGNLVINLDDAAVTDGQTIEGLAVDASTDKPIPLRGNVSIA